MSDYLRIRNQCIGIRILAVGFLVLCGFLSAEGLSSDEALLDQAQQLRQSGEFSKATQLLDTRLRESTQTDPHLILRFYLELSIIAFQENDLDTAYARADLGLAKARRLGNDPVIAQFLNVLGNLEKKAGDSHTARSYFLKAKDLRLQLEDLQGAASVANNLGILSFAEKRYLEASDWYEEALRYLETDENLSLRAAIFSNFAETLIRLREYTRAENLLFASMDLEKNIQNPVNIAYTYFNFGELYSAMGQFDRAEENFLQAHAIQKDLESKWSLALTCLRLAQNELARQRPDSAIAWLSESWEEVKRMNAPEMLSNYAGAFELAYELSGDFELANYYEGLQEIFFDLYTTPSESPTPIEKPGTSPTVWNKHLSGWGLLGVLGMVIFALIIENRRIQALLRANSAQADGKARSGSTSAS